MVCITFTQDIPLESFLFFCGSQDAAKSSIIARFLDKSKIVNLILDENVSPSVALEYTFGRRTRGVGQIKDIAHIYELGITRFPNIKLAERDYRIY